MQDVEPGEATRLQERDDDWWPTSLVHPLEAAESESSQRKTSGQVRPYESMTNGSCTCVRPNPMNPPQIYPLRSIRTRESHKGSRTPYNGQQNIESPTPSRHVDFCVLTCCMTLYDCFRPSCYCHITTTPGKRRGLRRNRILTPSIN